MKVPFVDLKLQYSGIKNEVKVAMDEVLDNTAYILGKSVANFESAFAEKHDVKFCSGVSSGTDGNHLVLWALGVGQGDEVIIPADTFIATAWGATLCGATPVFVDVDPESYNLDAAAVARAITPKTKAIVAVHLYGQPTDLDAINYELGILNYELKRKDFTTENTESTEKRDQNSEIRSQNAELKDQKMDSSLEHAGMTSGGGVFVHKETGKEEISSEFRSQNEELKNQGTYIHKTTGQVIYLVEDCAQSHLAEYKGKKVGGLAAAASFSFYPGKNLGAYGEGGAVCTNDEELGKKFKMMREHGSHQKYLHLMYGHNYRMEGLQGAVLGVKLNHLEKWTAGRRQAAEWYKKYLGDCDGVVLPKEMEGNKHVYHLFVIRVKDLTTEHKELSREIHESHEKDQKNIRAEFTTENTESTEKSKENLEFRSQKSELKDENKENSELRVQNSELNNKSKNNSEVRIQKSELKDENKENSELRVQNSELKDENKKGRDELMKFLGEKGVASGLHYPVPLHLQPCFEHLGYKKGDLPVTEDLADNCLSLPMFPELTEEQVAFVCECVKEFFS